MVNHSQELKTKPILYLRAGERIRGVFQNLFNDTSDEAKLLAFQLELLNSQQMLMDLIR